jgi:hypothetical protein
VLGVGTPLSGLLFGFRSVAFIAAELAAITAMLLLNNRITPILDRRARGVVGENEVGRLLDDLRPDGWRTLHTVPTGRGDIDHLLVGPGGIITVETKSHRGRIHVAAINPKWLKQAYAQKKFIERVAGVKPVDCLLVFSAAYLDQAVSRQRGVLVLPGRMLQEHLRRRDVGLTSEQVENVCERLTVALSAQHLSN